MNHSAYLNYDPWMMKYLEPPLKSITTGASIKPREKSSRHSVGLSRTQQTQQDSVTRSLPSRQLDLVRFRVLDEVLTIEIISF